MKYLTPRGVTILIVAGLLLIFAIQNSEFVRIKFLFFSLYTPRFALIAVLLLAGILIGRLTANWPRRKVKKNREDQTDL